MRKQRISNIAFYVTTVILTVIILLCAGGTVRSENRDEARHIEIEIQEQQLLTQMRQYLNENGYRNSGVTLTYVMDESGNCEYTFRIHHRRIHKMSEEELEAFSAELLQCFPSSPDSIITCEYLLTDY